MNLSCPKTHCSLTSNRSNIYKDGSYFRPSDGRRIQRFRCKICGKRFSRASFDLAKNQNKRRVNYRLKQLLCSGVSLRRSAKLLNVNRKTVARKLKYLAILARESQEKFLKSLQNQKINKIQFDDLLTIEHTKCKPLSVTIAVEDNTRKILGIEVSSMPAFGHLAEISRKKYGRRADDRTDGICRLFKKLDKIVSSNAKIISDEHKLYPKQVKKYFPNAVHIRFKGRKGCVAGQGELKKVYYDPLFSLNHTCAMLRANVNRLIRKTWCSTKDPKRLYDHLCIYINYHNEQLT